MYTKRRISAELALAENAEIAPQLQRNEGGNKVNTYPKLRVVPKNKNKNENENNKKMEIYELSKKDKYMLLFIKTCISMIVSKDSNIPMFQYKVEEIMKGKDEVYNASLFQYEYIEYCYERVEPKFREIYMLNSIKDSFKVGYMFNKSGILHFLRMCLSRKIIDNN